MDRLSQTRLNWLMDNEPERVLELYHNGRMLDLEDLLARDLQVAVQYIKKQVAQGMSELEAEDRAVELILAPSDGPEFSDNPPKPVPPELRVKIRDRLDVQNEALNRAIEAKERRKVVKLKPRS